MENELETLTAFVAAISSAFEEHQDLDSRQAKRLATRVRKFDILFWLFRLFFADDMKGR